VLRNFWRRLASAGAVEALLAGVARAARISAPEFSVDRQRRLVADGCLAIAIFSRLTQ
jgi:hypothetical protein